MFIGCLSAKPRAPQGVIGSPPDLSVVKIMVNYGGDECRGLSGVKCQVGVYVNIVVNYGENR